MVAQRLCRPRVKALLDGSHHIKASPDSKSNIVGSSKDIDDCGVVDLCAVAHWLHL
jgi:hypothetical protein